MKKVIFIFSLIILLWKILPAQNKIEGQFSIDSTLLTNISKNICPLTKYVTIEPSIGSESPAFAVPITREEAYQLRVKFLRENIPSEYGFQFLKITTTIYDKLGSIEDIFVQFAVTFPKVLNQQNEIEILLQNLKKLTPYGIISPEIFEYIKLDIDTLSDWSRLKVEVELEENFVRYAGRVKERMVWHYLIKGNRIDYGFFLGVPKVLFDTRKTDTVTYGTVSAIFRFFYLNEETGEPFPVNIGIGTFGIGTPIEVSSQGGGFVISLFFDVIQALRTRSIKLSQKVNAGIELAPFFPIQKKSRLLLNIRIGYSP